MVLVDTSVWIALYRRRDRALGHRLWQLAARNEAAVCGQVWVEFIGGFRRDAKRRQYAEQLEAYPWLDASRDVYGLAAEWCARHAPLGAGDTIIAATAFVHGASLLTRDRQFEALSEHGLLVEVVS